MVGLSWDEGPEVGGPYEPYRQSQRRDLHLDVVRRLVEAGEAYESFSTPDEVEARHKAAGRDPKLGYDNFDRDLTPEQVQAYLDEGRKPVVRLRMPDHDLTWNDLVRGETTFKAGTVPDFALTRGNGIPLYTLVNPVDDALMKITHVLRGEDLLSSTPRQLALYEALERIGVADFTPEFGHLPFVMGQGNKKLSKRDPESNLSSTAIAVSSPKDCSTTWHCWAGASPTTTTSSPSTRWSPRSTSPRSIPIRPASTEEGRRDQRGAHSSARAGRLRCPPARVSDHSRAPGRRPHRRAVRRGGRSRAEPASSFCRTRGTC